ncbi:ExbD/TolR family protein [Sungkyunkwania multivorans]|uniref:ExbD/TolR family protein n=1 Tax=Sungkyunkwania multivorans TaxID=1173618 RepID=A0ABW3CTK6_9FLAO
MSKFKKKKSGDLPPVSTASLPDIVFMLLFFFMTVTVMKDDTIKVTQTMPRADQVHELDKKDPVVYIYAGKPTSGQVTTSQIQIGDKIVDVSEIKDYVILEVNDKIAEEKKSRVTVAFKVDKETNMGLISDIKQELRDANLLKINYITVDREAVTQQ